MNYKIQNDRIRELVSTFSPEIIHFIKHKKGHLVYTINNTKLCYYFIG